MGLAEQVRLPVHPHLPAGRAGSWQRRRGVTASLLPRPRPQRGGPLCARAFRALHLDVSPGVVWERGLVLQAGVSPRGDETSPGAVRVGSLSLAPYPDAVDKHFCALWILIVPLQFDGGVGIRLLAGEGGNLREKLKVSSSRSGAGVAVEQVLRGQGRRHGVSSLLCILNRLLKVHRLPLDDFCARPFCVVRKTPC